MTVEKMSVHKALSERKIIDSRIKSVISSNQFVAVNKHSNEKIDGLLVTDYKKNLQGAWDKVSGLMKRRDAINRAVTLSNATTKVEIGGGEYTVAEAIWMKNHGMELYQLLHRELKNHLSACLVAIEKWNGKELEERAEKYITGLYGDKDKVNADDVEKVRRQFFDNYKLDLIDPIHASEKIEELEKKINDFMVDVDSALSVSNAVTEITIEY